MSDNLPKMLQNTINGTDVTFEHLYNGSQADGAYYKDASGYYKKVDGKTPAGVQRYNFIGGGSNNTCITLNGAGADKDEKIDLTTNLTGGHALTVTAVTDDTITIINPWDSEKEVTVNRSDFEGYIKGLQYLKLS